MMLAFSVIFSAFVIINCGSQPISTSTQRGLIPLLFDLKRLSANPGRSPTVYENVKPGWYRLPNGVIANFNSSNFGFGDYPNKLRQTWRFYSENCDFWLTCPCFRVQESLDCFKDYLRVYSNAFSEKEYCGKKVISPTIPKKRRYLVLHFHTSRLVGDAGFRCSVGCGENNPGPDLIKDACPWNDTMQALPSGLMEETMMSTEMPAAPMEEMVPSSEISSEPMEEMMPTEESEPLGESMPVIGRNDCECGTVSPNASRESRVRGGYKVDPSEYPWVVGLFHETEEGQRVFRCAGTLLSDRHVLTDFACIKHPMTANLVVAGVHDLSQASSQMRNWREISSLRPFLGSNLALAMLDSPLQLGPGKSGLRTLCLPPDSLKKEASVSWGVLSGWGSARENNSTQLHAAAVRIHMGSACRDKLRPEIWVKDKEGCTEDMNDLGACAMDEGGPVMVQDGNRMVLVGVLRRPSCQGKPSVFSSVSGYAAELRKETELNGITCSMS